MKTTFKKLRGDWLWLGLAALAATLIAASPVAAGDPDALWKIVHGKCAPNEAATGEPAPCLAVDLSEGYAVLKDLVGATQVLVIPTARVTGIEDPALLAPDAPLYWRDAWAARRYVSRLAGRPIPREDLALAVNSEDGRSQDQLHIHVDCIRADVKAALAEHVAEIGPRWAPLDVELAGRRYQAMRLPAAALETTDPFRLLASGQPAAAAHMGLETLVLAAVTLPGGGPGFVLLSDQADLAAGDFGSGESLQDHDCQVLKPAP